MNISIEVDEEDLIIGILRIAYDLDVSAKEMLKIATPKAEQVEEVVEEPVEEEVDEEPVDTGPAWHGHGSPALTPQELYELYKEEKSDAELASAMFPDLLSLTSVHHKYVNETLQWAKEYVGESEEEDVEVEDETEVIDEVGFTTQDDCPACNGLKRAHTCGYLGRNLRPSVAIIEEQFTTKKDCKACKGKKTKHTCGHKGRNLRPTVIAKRALLERLETDTKTIEIVEETVEEDKSEEVKPSTDKSLTCKECGTTNSPQWRDKKESFGPLCNACGIRRKRKGEVDSELEVVEEKPEMKKPLSPHTRKKSGRSWFRTSKKSKTASGEQTLAEIDQIDRDVHLVALYNAEIYELQDFVDSHDGTLSKLLDLGESDVANMKRQAVAMIRSNRMRGIARTALKQKPEKPTVNVDSLVDSDYATYAWEGIAYFKSQGTMFIQREVVDMGIEYAEDKRIIEGDRDKFRKDLNSTVAEMFEIISKHDSQFLLTKDDSVGMVMVSLTRDVKWPTRKEVIGDL